MGIFLGKARRIGVGGAAAEPCAIVGLRAGAGSPQASSA